MTSRLSCVYGTGASRFASLFALTLFLCLLLPSRAIAQASTSIDWLKKDLSCDDLTREIRERYSKAGGYGDLDSQKKEELGLVLDIICGARFAKCGFKNCKKIAPVASPAVPSDIVVPQFVDYRAEAKRLLEQRIAKQAEKLRLDIDAARRKEAAEKRGWVRISVTADAGPEEVIEEQPPEAADVAEPAPRTRPRAPAPQEQSKAPDSTARGQVKSSYAMAASPALPMVDVVPTLATPNGKKKGKFLSKSDPEYHRISIATDIPHMALPGTMPSQGAK